MGFPYITRGFIFSCLKSFDFANFGNHVKSYFQFGVVLVLIFTPWRMTHCSLKSFPLLHLCYCRLCPNSLLRDAMPLLKLPGRIVAAFPSQQGWLPLTLCPLQTACGQFLCFSGMEMGLSVSLPDWTDPVLPNSRAKCLPQCV